MVRFGKLQYTVNLILITVLLLGIYLRLSAFHECLHYASREEGNVALPMKVLFPTDFINEKVDLSIGIICNPDEWFIDNVIKSIKSVTDQIEETDDIRTYIVFVGILSNKTDEINNVKKLIVKSKELKDIEITFVVVDTNRLRSRFSSDDIAPALFQESIEHVELRGHINMLLAALYWYASQSSQYLLLTDARYTLNNGALSKYIKEIESRGGADRVLRITNVKVEGIFGTFYGCNKALVGLAEFLYWTSPYKEIEGLMLYYEHLVTSHDKIKVDSDMFSKHEISVPGVMVENNPVAMVTTNMTVVGEYFPTNPYERGEMFWTSTPSQGSFIIIKFVQTVRIKHIRIDTGKNIYLSDSLTKAVLEESNQFIDNDCGKYQQIADFRSGKIDLDISSRNKVSACLRIRLLVNQDHWIAIRLIRILT